MTEIDEMTEVTETTEEPAARPALWVTQQDGRRSPALPEATISRIANLLSHGVARPEDAGELVRAAEAVRALRGGSGNLRRWWMGERRRGC